LKAAITRVILNLITAKTATKALRSKPILNDTSLSIELSTYAFTASFLDASLKGLHERTTYEDIFRTVIEAMG
jgi:hypothetical protein